MDQSETVENDANVSSLDVKGEADKGEVREKLKEEYFRN